MDLDAAERLIALIHICIKNVWEMPKHAPELECSVEGKAILVALAKSRTEEAQAVERARIILANLKGKEIQQVAREMRVSVATVSKWRQRFSLWGTRGYGRRAVRYLWGFMLCKILKTWLKRAMQ